jgi:predicted transcriptional regulator
MTELLSGLQDVRKLMELGEPLDHELLREILSEVSRLAPGMPQSKLRLLSGEIDRVVQLVEEQKANIAEQLTDIHRGRQGIDGYNHLQAVHKAQRLSKRA